MKPAPIDPPEIHHQLWADVAPDYMGWDVGANCGQTLPEMTRRFTRVVAFEPATECQPHLAPWRDGVDIRQVAISDHDGEVTLAALPDKIDTGQLVTPGTHGMEWNPDVPGAVARTIPCRTIDSLAFGDSPGRPNFIKVDVEGHERHVLDGAALTIEAYRPQWLIEFHTRDLHDYCRDLLLATGDYQVQTVRHPHYHPGTGMWFTHGWLKATHAD